MKKNVLPADTFVVINKTILNDQDRKLLVMLYQPIIGQVAVSLYFTLWSYLDKNELFSMEWSHHHLMMSMRLKLSEVVEAREKLEAIGLIRTYFKTNHVNHYAYLLYSPISASEFFKNPILSTSLYHNVGDSEYQKLIEYFRMPSLNLKEYEDVTCHFDEVFEAIPTTSMEHFVEDIRRKNQNSLEFLSKIDLEDVFSLIPEEMLNPKSITKETRELLYKISFIYHLDEENLRELVRNSLNEKRMIDKEKLSLNSRKFYQFEHNGKLPSLVYRTQPEYLRKPVGDTSNRAKLIYQFETTSPYDFLTSKSKKKTLSKNEQLILNELVFEFDMKPGVINVLLDYILKIDDNKLNPAFVSSVASQWARSKVKTVEDAMRLAEKEYQKRKQKAPKVKREVKKPEWFDETLEKKQATEEEQREMAALLDAFKK